jgi:DNA mismatch repair protein MutL
MHIHSIITRYAIAYPAIEFYLSHNGITQLELLPSKTTKERIAHFFGREFADELIHKQIEDDPFFIDAYLALPQYSRTTTDGQFFFVNNRYVRDKIIARNLNLAYRELIPYGRYPCAFIFVYTLEKEVDVNVHPTKIEVKFKNSYKLAQIIERRLREALLEACVSPAIKLEQFESGKSLYDEVVDFFTKPAQEITTTQTHQLKVFAEERRFFHVKGLYIILEEEDGIRIIDQHALHERYIYEQLKKQFKVSDIKRQKLLMPKVVELTKEEFLILEDNRPLVNSAGIEYEIFGPETISVHTLPTLLQEEDTGSVIRDLVNLIKQKQDALSLVEEILQFMACRFALKSGKVLAQEEIKRIIESREELENPQTCVHGRPISVKITFKELEKLFHRR